MLPQREPAGGHAAAHDRSALQLRRRHVHLRAVEQLRGPKRSPSRRVTTAPFDDEPFTGRLLLESAMGAPCATTGKSATCRSPSARAAADARGSARLGTQTWRASCPARCARRDAALATMSDEEECVVFNVLSEDSPPMHLPSTSSSCIDLTSRASLRDLARIHDRLALRPSERLSFVLDIPQRCCKAVLKAATRLVGHTTCSTQH